MILWCYKSCVSLLARPAAWLVTTIQSHRTAWQRWSLKLQICKSLLNQLAPAFLTKYVYSMFLSSLLFCLYQLIFQQKNGMVSSTIKRPWQGCFSWLPNFVLQALDAVGRRAEDFEAESIVGTASARRLEARP